MDKRTGAAHDVAVLGSVGRKRVRFALSDENGTLRPETIRSYDAKATTGVSAALIDFQRDLALPAIPSRAAIAVAGLARGDTISITNTHWFVSRTGLRAMTGCAPLILNDFTAEAWAICGADVCQIETFSTQLAPELKRPGCYVVLGITSGLGVSVINRSETGAVTLLSTEAGHGAFAAATGELAQLASDMFPGLNPVMTEQIVSAPGLAAIYAFLAQRGRTAVRIRTPEEITRSAATDPVARAACELLAKAFWAQAGNLVMTFGAWDGVLVTGALANAIRPFLQRPDTQTLFATSPKYQRMLQNVPRAFVTLANAQLIGLAEALRYERVKSSAGVG
ncbi:glucokinase [Sphingomonas sp.]|uniref:glucokinase n=1 Tax=Sphingomonas sp. TaxID=28214 RepID=UPI0025E00180|nr:glucokinase [Sphingomonas sp.]